DSTIFGFRCLIEWSPPFNAGVVKSDVESAKFLGRKIDHRFDVCIFCNVSPEKCCLAAEFLNFPNDFCSFFLAAPGQHNLRAGSSKLDCSGFSNSGGSSGYQDYFTFKPVVIVHYLSFHSLVTGPHSKGLFTLAVVRSYLSDWSVAAVRVPVTLKS